MSKENLIPLKKAGDLRSDIVRKKLKGSASDKRKIAQRISGLKYANPDNIDKKLQALITNPNLSALQIQELIEIALERDLSDGNFIRLIDTAIKKHSAIFGSKMEVSSNVKFQEELNQWREALKEKNGSSESN